MGIIGVRVGRGSGDGHRAVSGVSQS
jgi:hypothetical protein